MTILVAVATATSIVIFIFPTYRSKGRSRANPSTLGTVPSLCGELHHERVTQQLDSPWVANHRATRRKKSAGTFARHPENDERGCYGVENEFMGEAEG